jgi:hypothetical protein
MGLPHVTVTLRAIEGGRRAYRKDFLVDTGATDTFAPGIALRRAGILVDPANKTPKRLPAIPLK